MILGWLVEALSAECKSRAWGELAAELGGILLGASHEVLEVGILASLKISIVIQVHFLENITNIGNT